MLNFICICFAFILSGCGPRYLEKTKLTDEGIVKPHVVLFPISCKEDGIHEINWNYRDEMQEDLTTQLTTSDKLYLRGSPEKLAEYISNIDENDMDTLNLFMHQNNLSYGIYICLDQHNIVPSKYNREADLIVSLNLKIIDFSNKIPRVIAEENFARKYHLSGDLDELEKHKKWTSKQFHRHPLYAAHQRFANEVLKEIERKIDLSKPLSKKNKSL